MKIAVPHRPALRRRDGGREWRWWAGLAVLFVALGAEEFLAVHELTIGPLRSALGVGGLCTTRG